MDDIQKLIEQLRSQDPIARNNAMNVLGNIGRPAVPHLVTALQSPDVEMRRDALYALSRIRDFNSAPFVLKMLKDKDASIREIAAKLLGELQYEWGLPELAQAFRDKDFRVRAGATYGMAKIGKPALPYFIEAAKDENVNVRRNAMWCIRDEEDVSTLPTVIPAFQDADESVREAAMQAIEYLVKSSKKSSELDLIEKGINGLFKRTGSKKKSKKLEQKIRLRLIKAKNDIAIKRNEIAEDKGVMLDDLPKPPGRRGGMYRRSGKVRNR